MIGFGVTTHRPGVALDPAQGADEDSQAAGVEEFHVFQVQDQMVSSGQEQLLDQLVQLRRAQRVELTAHRHHDGVLIGSGRQGQIHGPRLQRWAE